MTSSGFHRLPHGHRDLVLALDCNLYGTRMVTASSDHRITVWDRNDKAGVWAVTDSWTGHDAEVTDVKWNGPFVGEHIGSIGEDGYLRIWQEDVSEARSSGRRFKKIFERLSDNGVPYISLGFKNLASETYLAAATRDGTLTIFEPEDHDDLSSWRRLWAERVCETTPPRTEETAFRLSWHKEKLPAWPAILAGLDRKSLGIAVAAGNTVKIFRSDKERNFYLAATLEDAAGLVRDVSWADGSMRGYDIIATASKDGCVRVYELHTPGVASLSTSAQAQIDQGQSNPPHSRVSRPSARSGIGAGLANGTRGHGQTSPTAAGSVKQEPKLVAEFEVHEGAPWRVSWSSLSDLLISTGDDGKLQMWRKAIDGKWLETAQVDGNF